MSGEDGWIYEDSWTGILIGNLKYERDKLLDQNRRLLKAIRESGIAIDPADDRYRFYDTEKVGKLLDRVQAHAYLRDDCVGVSDLLYQVRVSLDPKR